MERCSSLQTRIGFQYPQHNIYSHPRHSSTNQVPLILNVNPMMWRPLQVHFHYELKSPVSCVKIKVSDIQTILTYDGYNVFRLEKLHVIGSQDHYVHVYDLMTEELSEMQPSHRSKDIFQENYSSYFWTFGHHLIDIDSSFAAKKILELVIFNEYVEREDSIFDVDVTLYVKLNPSKPTSERQLSQRTCIM